MTVNMLQHELHLPKRHVTALFKRQTDSVFLVFSGLIIKKALNLDYINRVSNNNNNLKIDNAQLSI